MRILIANDDGIYSPGIIALAEVAIRFGEVRIVAPDVEQSSMELVILLTRTAACYGNRGRKVFSFNQEPMLLWEVRTTA
jgi:5'/3'-nucleotidase SurE